MQCRFIISGSISAVPVTPPLRVPTPTRIGGEPMETRTPVARVAGSTELIECLVPRRYASTARRQWWLSEIRGRGKGGLPFSPSEKFHSRFLHMLAFCEGECFGVRRIFRRPTLMGLVFVVPLLLRR